MASFTDIVKEQRSQGAGVFGSLGKATGQRTLERIDPRNYLFNRNGLAAALFPGLKGFQAKTGTTSKLNEASSSSLSSGQIDSLAVKIEIVAKNTLVLPLMARDMNVMRQNIIKLVKLSGGKATNRADHFFMTAKQRQEAYESQFGKKSQSPTQIGKKDDVEKKSGNWFSNLIDFLFSAKGLLSLGILAGLGKLLENEKFRATMIEWVGGFFKAIFNGIAVTADFLGTILTDPAVVESIKNMFSHLFDLAKKIAFLPVTEIEILGHKFTVNLLEAVLGSMAVWFGTKGAMTAMGSILMKSIAGDAIGAAAGGLISRALITALGVALAPEVLVAAEAAALAYGINDYMKSNKQGKALDSGNFKQFRESIWKAGKYDHEADDETAEETQRLNDETVAKLKKIEADEKATPYRRGVAHTHLAEISSGVLKLPEPKDMKAITSQKLKSTTPTPAGSSGDAKSQAEKYLGTGINDDDWEMLKHAVYAESSNNKEEYANVMAVILNRARNSGKSIRDVLFEPNQFQSVTGPGSTENFKKGPTLNISKTIDESATLLSGISQNLDSFTSADPNAYKDVGGQEKYNAKMEEMNSHNAKQIGQTKFAENMYSGGNPTQVASNNNTGRSVNQQSSFIADAKIFNPTDMMASAFSDMNSLLSALGANLGGSQNITSINSQLAAANPYDTDMVKLFLESFA